MSLRVLELYSGIGGFHHALLAALPGRAMMSVTPYDNNPNANATYALNFAPTTVRTKAIEHVSIKDLDALDCQLWLMSPPCQPYTRGGARRMHADARACSFTRLLRDVLPFMSNPPRALVVENVIGFQESETFALLLRVFGGLGYVVALHDNVTPTMCGIPNTRRRVFITATRMPSLPWSLPPPPVPRLRDFFSGCRPATPLRYVISTPSSCNTDCFTKGYAAGVACDLKFVRGCGSLFLDPENDDEEVVIRSLCEANNDGVLRIPGGVLIDSRYINLFFPNRLRFFHSEELLRLFGFPESFVFPVGTTEPTRLKLLGNSLCVANAAEVIRSVCASLS